MAATELTEDCWLYSKDGARLFKAGEIVPDGFYDSPASVPQNDQDQPAKKRGRPRKGE